MHWIGYIFWLLGQVIASTAAVVLDTLRVHNTAAPILLYYPLRIDTPWEKTFFSTSITMTPGTLSLGFCPTDEVPGAHSLSGELLLVHAVYGSDPRSVLESLAEMETRIAPRVGGSRVRYEEWMLAGNAANGYKAKADSNNTTAGSNNTTADSTESKAD